MPTKLLKAQYALNLTHQPTPIPMTTPQLSLLPKFLTSVSNTKMPSLIQGRKQDPSQLHPYLLVNLISSLFKTLLTSTHFSIPIARIFESHHCTRTTETLCNCSRCLHPCFPQPALHPVARML